jgi:hypothetical protein
MAESESVEEVKAEHRERMIVLKIMFFTDEIANKGKGWVLPKHCSANGMIHAQKNGSHGISRERHGEPFHSLLEIGPAIEKILKEHGIVLHPSREMGYLLGTEQKKAKSAAAGK